MGLFPTVLDEAKNKGIDLAPKHIPAEVFDNRAVEQGQVVFHDVAFIEVKPHIEAGGKDKPATVAVELIDFSVFYSQDSVSHAEQTLKNRSSRIVVGKGTSRKGEQGCRWECYPGRIDQRMDRLD